MFESIKAKLKGLFKKGKDLDESSIYSDEAPATPAPAQEPVKQETVAVPEPAVTKVEEPVAEPKAEPKVEPVVTPEPQPVKVEEPAPVVAEPAPAVKEAPKAEPVAVVPEPAAAPEPEPVVEKKPLSKKERKEAAKNKNRNKPRAEDMLSTGLLSKKIKTDAMDDILDELEVILLESDVAYEVVQQIIDGTRNNLLGKKYSRSYTQEQVVELAVKDAVFDVLEVNEFDFDEWIEGREAPVKIMFVGINGTGKTTAIAKIANRLKNQDKSVVLAACDTFRAGAIQQLTVHSENLGVKIVKSEQDADPASVAFNAIEHATSKKKDVVLIDTAGRMQTNNNLIAEMQKITRVAKPDLKIFVGDSLAGNDAIQQAKVFDDAIGIDAIILTKIDTDAKGGAALSIAKTIGKPIAFVCDGQEYKDISKFDSEWMLNRLFESMEA